MTRRPPSPLLVPGLVLALYLALPLVAALLSAGGADWRGADWPGIADATAISAASASIATALIALGGVPLGFLLARRHGPAWRVAATVVQLPLALPPLGSGILLLLMLGPGSRLTDTVAGIVLAQVFVASPFAVIAARSAFGAVDPAIEEAAATLGHDPASVFFRVALPVAARPVLAGLLLAWLRAFGEFGATVLVSYHPETLPVFTYVAFGSEGLPAMLPVLAPALAATLLAGSGAALLARWPRRHSPSAAPPTAPPPAPLRPAPSSPGPFRLRARVTAGSFTLDLDWRPEKRRLAILGASGSGKSLTLRAIAGLATPGAAVAVQLGALDLGRSPPERRRIGWVPQSYGLVPGLPVARQIRFSPDSDEAEARRWTERFGLAALAERTPDTLSGGERQRVALARAMARPATRLLLLDEPFSALDATLRRRLRAETSRFADEIDAVVVLVTHDPAEAMEFADELLLLDGGRAIQGGPVETVFRRPAGDLAAQLLGASGAAAATVSGDRRILVGDGIALAVGADGLPPPGTSVGWAVRADQVCLADAGHRATIIRRDAAPRGGRHALLLRIGDATIPALADPSSVPSGIDAFVRIDPLAVQVWPRPGLPGDAAQLRGAATGLS